jgi:hypothetical protein
VLILYKSGILVLEFSKTSSKSKLSVKKANIKIKKQAEINNEFAVDTWQE